MLTRKLSLIAGVSLVAIGVAGGALSADKSADVPLTTPPGIILVDVTKLLQNSSDQFLWRRLGDSTGKPLYTYDADGKTGKSTCVDECAKEFTPYLAPAGAVASGDWSLVDRGGGQKQWAYQGQPLYRYSGEDPAGQPVSGGLSTTGAEDPAWHDPGSKVFSPKQGWKRAAFTPESTVAHPGDIELKSLGVANGYGFVSKTSGRALYMLKTPPKNNLAWTPVYAPSLAAPVGDFTIMPREDGTRQWSYKGQRLYSYNEDYSDGDVNGTLAQKDAQVALAYRNFMPKEVAVEIIPGRGPLMVAAKGGLSLYTEARYHLQYGGRETRDGYRFPYNDAKAVGTRGCVDECTKTWRPLLAPANATGGGPWEVETRPDGSKQWSYKGSPLYTYAGDKKPGDIEGNNRYEIVYGDAEGKVDLSVTGGDQALGRNNAGSGFYWHVVTMVY
jgi:predicted lipoprotein with Yx(FWY)xxD motif